LAIYFGYNYIEPHFNSKIGIVRQKKLDRITSKEHMAMSDIGNLLHGYGKSAVGQVWDLSGEINLREIFENKPEEKELSIGSWEMESKFKTWLKISLVWITFFVTLYAIAFVAFGFILALDIQSIDLIIWSSVIVQFLILFIILIIVLLLEDNIEYLSSLFVVPDIKKSALLVILVSILDFILVWIYSWLYGQIYDLPSDQVLFVEASSANDPLILLLLFICLAIAAPLVEEIFFRGYILDKLRNVHSDTFAIISTGILFGFMHWDPIFGFYDLYQTGAVTIGGFLYAWLRIKTGSLWPSIACHSIWNGAIFFFAFVL
jgi:membrane protease YdiL (CAAX protease family)